jgi:hypothetical protein
VDRVGLNNKGLKMNIELDEVVVLDASDDALELAAGGAQGGGGTIFTDKQHGCC